MKLKILAFLASLGSLLSCSSNKLDIDVSGISVPLDIKRFDRAIASLDKSSPSAGVLAVARDYPAFIELYNVNIIKVGSMYNAEYPQRLKLFLAYDVFDEINIQVAKEFGTGVDTLMSMLEPAFKHYRFYFPGKPIPTIYTFNGGFNQSIVIDSAVLGIGLDKYLGTGNALYKMLEMEQFKKAGMVPGRVAPDCMQAVFESEFPFNFSTENLLSTMISDGRKMYFVKAMIPGIADTTLWGFSSSQMEFCNSYESNMWNYLVDNKLLFDSDYMNIRRFTSEGPFTSAFSKESPARAASWVGFRIVSSFMEHNPAVGLNDLLAETDYQKIMNKAKYNP